MKDGEAVEGLRQVSAKTMRLCLELDLRRIAQAPPIKSGGISAPRISEMRRAWRSRGERSSALAEDLRLVVLLDAEALARMRRPRRFSNRSRMISLVMVMLQGMGELNGGRRAPDQTGTARAKFGLQRRQSRSEASSEDHLGHDGVF